MTKAEPGSEMFFVSNILYTVDTIQYTGNSAESRPQVFGNMISHGMSHRPSLLSLL